TRTIQLRYHYVTGGKEFLATSLNAKPRLGSRSHSGSGSVPTSSFGQSRVSSVDDVPVAVEEDDVEEHVAVGAGGGAGGRVAAIGGFGDAVDEHTGHVNRSLPNLLAVWRVFCDKRPDRDLRENANVTNRRSLTH